MSRGSLVCCPITHLHTAPEVAASPKQTIILQPVCFCTTWRRDRPNGAPQFEQDISQTTQRNCDKNHSRLPQISLTAAFLKDLLCFPAVVHGAEAPLAVRSSKTEKWLENCGLTGSTETRTGAAQVGRTGLDHSTAHAAKRWQRRCQAIIWAGSLATVPSVLGNYVGSSSFEYRGSLEANMQVRLWIAGGFSPPAPNSQLVLGRSRQTGETDIYSIHPSNHPSIKNFLWSWSHDHTPAPIFTSPGGATVAETQNGVKVDSSRWWKIYLFIFFFKGC